MEAAFELEQVLQELLKLYLKRKLRGNEKKQGVLTSAFQTFNGFNSTFPNSFDNNKFNFCFTLPPDFL